MFNKNSRVGIFGGNEVRNAMDVNPVLAQTVVLQNHIMQKYWITEPQETFIVQMLCLATNTYPKVLDCFCKSDSKEAFFMNVLKSKISTKAHAEIMNLSQDYFNYGLLSTLVAKFPVSGDVVKAHLSFKGCTIVKRLYSPNNIVFFGEMRTAFETAVCDDVFHNCEFVDFKATDDFTLSIEYNRMTFSKGKYRFYFGKGWIVWEAMVC